MLSTVDVIQTGENIVHHGFVAVLCMTLLPDTVTTHRKEGKNGDTERQEKLSGDIHFSGFNYVERLQLRFSSENQSDKRLSTSFPDFDVSLQIKCRVSNIVFI